MKLLVFSDIHGNVFALEGLLAKEQLTDYDKIIFCGDVIGYFPFAGLVIDALAGINDLIAVKGNHDDWFLRSLEDRTAQEQLVEKYGISYRSVLDEAQRDYLSQLPTRIVFDFDGMKVGICHGSWNDPLCGRVYPDTPASVWTTEVTDDLDLLLCGHTHYAMEKVADSFRLVNPGSLGQPRDGGGFRYCVIDTEAETVDFRTVLVDEREIGLLLESEPNESLRRYLLGKIYV